MTEYILSILAFRKRSKKKDSIPDIAPNHFVIKVGKEKFYCFDNLNNLPVMRTMQLDAFLKQEADMNIDRRLLENAVDKILEFLDPSAGTVRVGDSVKILTEIKKRLSMLTLPEHLYKVAAVCYFTGKDDFEDMLSPTEIDRRVELLKKKIPVSDLLGKSMPDILKTLNYSEKDFTGFLKLKILEQQAIADSQNRLFQSFSTSMK